MTRHLAAVTLLPLLFGCAQPAPDTMASSVQTNSNQAGSPQAASKLAAVQATINGFARGTTTYDQAVAALGQPASSQNQPDGYRMVIYRDAPTASSATQNTMLQQGLASLTSNSRFGSLGSMMPRQGAPPGETYQLVFDRSGLYQGVSTASPTGTTSGIDPSQLLHYLPGNT